MRIKLTSVMVDDQDKALKFYTDLLGFQKKTDIPMGEHRWLTVASSEEPITMGVAKLAVFDDTCGNNIQIFEVV